MGADPTLGSRSTSTSTAAEPCFNRRCAMGDVGNRAWGRRGLVLILAVAGVVYEARAQAPAESPAPDQPARGGDPAKGQTLPLSNRYRFVEQYSDVLDLTHPEWLTQYEVGSRETVKMVRELPQGAPERGETSLQTIYTERVSRLSPQRQPIEVVRRYDKARFSTTIPVRLYQNPGLLEDLRILYRMAPGKPIQIFNLSEGRRFRQHEFDEIIRNPFLPRLASYLPTTGRRVGDVWQVPPAMTAQLLSEPLANDPDYSVEGELIEVRGAAPGTTTSTAVLGFKGEVLAGEGAGLGLLSFNARVHFTFTPSAPTPAPAPAPGATPSRRKIDPTIEALGYVSEIRLAETRSIPLGEGEGRLKQNITRELVLARRVSADRGGLPMTAPDTVSANDPAQTWVTYDHTLGAFHVDHPQYFRIARDYPEGGVDLLAGRPDGPDVVSMTLVPKTGDAAKDRLAADPLERKKKLMDQWKAQGQDILQGPDGWLKDPEWEQLNRKVYRLEVALKPEGPDDPGAKTGRIYLDDYVVQLPGDQTFIVEAWTTQDPHLDFRNQVETMIKRFNLGPSEGPAPLPAAAPPR